MKYFKTTSKQSSIISLIKHETRDEFKKDKNSKNLQL